MISISDVVLLLSDLKKEKDIDVQPYILSTWKNGVTKEVLKFIYDNKSLDVINFYEKIRKQYNNKHSKLYINLMNEDRKNPLVTLASLQVQILLFAETVEDKTQFYRFVRAKEISKCLSLYYSNYNTTVAISLLEYIKADIKVLEEIRKGE